MSERPGSCLGCGMPSQDEYCRDCDIEIEEEEIEEVYYCDNCDDEKVENKGDWCATCDGERPHPFDCKCNDCEAERGVYKYKLKRDEEGEQNG